MPSAQATGHARPVVAELFDTDRDELAQPVGPGYELPVPAGGGRHAMGAQRAAELVDGVGDVELLVRVDTDGDLWGLSR